MARTELQGHSLANRRHPSRLDLDFLHSLRDDRKTRDDLRLFWADGLRSYFAALRAHRPIHAIVACSELLERHESGRKVLHSKALLDVNSSLLWVDKRSFLELSNAMEPQGIGIVAEQRWGRLIATDIHPSDLWVALDDARTPGNVGTILRTCAAVGASGLMCVGGGTDPHNPSAVRASMGAIFQQKLIRTSAKALSGWRRRHVCRIIGTSPQARLHYRRATYRGPLLILLGSERSGLRERQRALCDEVVRLPMAGAVDSLNIAVAAGIVLYEALDQRTKSAIE